MAKSVFKKVRVLVVFGVVHLFQFACENFAFVDTKINESEIRKKNPRRK